MKLNVTAIALLLPLTLVSGCTVAPPRGGSVGEEIKQALTESQQQSQELPKATPTVSSVVANALTPPLSIDLSQTAMQPVERRFDITVKSVPAGAFFMGLVKDTSYNMIVPPKLEGRITLAMKNVTIGEVLNAVRDIYGYEYRKTAMGYTVMSPGMQSRIFKIDYLNVQRSGVSQVRVSSGQVTAKQTAPNNTVGSSQEPEAISGSEVNTRSNSDFWADLRTALTAIIGTQDGRKVIINPQSGMLIIRAMPRELREVESYLKQTQAIIQRQVILEAKIVEVTLNDGYQTGVNWSLIAHNGDQSVVAGQFGGGSIFSTGASNLKGQNNALDPTDVAGIRSDMATAFGGMFAMSLNLGDFTSFLEFLKTQGNVHVLSSPRVSTVNNQKAVIKVGTDEFFVTDINTQSTTLSGATSSDQNVDVELTPFFSGVALDVTPEISDTNEVTLHIHPSVSEVSEKVKNININNNNNLSLPLAQSTIRESDSIVRARNGQVVVIGGLMQNQTQDDVASVPILGDLPLLGELFRHRQQITRKTELVILLRPIVVTGNQDWTESITRATTHFDHLQTADRENATVP